MGPMKWWFMGAVALGLAIWPSVSSVQAASDEPSQHQRSDDPNDRIDREASTPEGAQVVQQRLMSEFSVDEARVQSLRDQKLGYGEIHHVLSLAQRMPGGITDDNVHQILTLRQDQHLGWGVISKQVTGDSLGAAEGPHGARDSARSVVHSGQPPAVQPFGTGSSAAGRTHGNGKAAGWPGTRGGSSFDGGLGSGHGHSGMAPGHLR